MKCPPSFTKDRFRVTTLNRFLFPKRLFFLRFQMRTMVVPRLEAAGGTVVKFEADNLYVVFDNPGASDSRARARVCVCVCARVVGLLNLATLPLNLPADPSPALPASRLHADLALQASLDSVRALLDHNRGRDEDDHVTICIGMDFGPFVWDVEDEDVFGHARNRAGLPFWFCGQVRCGFLGVGDGR